MTLYIYFPQVFSRRLNRDLAAKTLKSLEFNLFFLFQIHFFCLRCGLLWSLENSSRSIEWHSFVLFLNWLLLFCFSKMLQSSHLTATVTRLLFSIFPPVYWLHRGLSPPRGADPELWPLHIKGSSWRMLIFAQVHLLSLPLWTAAAASV